MEGTGKAMNQYQRRISAVALIEHLERPSACLNELGPGHSNLCASGLLRQDQSIDAQSQDQTHNNDQENHDQVFETATTRFRAGRWSIQYH
jgi:hypothetical protein